jgi:hypothetical protein
LRLRSGRAAKELAAKHFVEAPGVLDQIMSSADSNPRHRIEAVRELRPTANLGNEGHAAAAEEKFTIIINLGADSDAF